MIPYTPIPILFSIGSFNIYTWGTIVAFAIIFSLLMVMRKSEKFGIKPDNVLNAFLWLVLGALIGGKIGYVMFNLDKLGIEMLQGGFASFGAICGGIITMMLYTKTNKINFWKIADLFAPYIALSFAIGRIGCFLRGCCFGLPTDLPWGVLYSQGSLASQIFSVPLHPTQLYESIACFAIAFLLFKLEKRKAMMMKINGFSACRKCEAFPRKKGKKLIEGSLFLLFIILYFAQRFLIDFMRYYPAKEHLGPFTLMQIASVFVIIAAAIIIKNKKERKS